MFQHVEENIVTDLINALPGNSNNRGSCVFRVRGYVTTVGSDHVT
jgi:hypothetical protein